MIEKTLLSECGEEVRKNDNDRYICALFAPENVRDKLFSIYAFNCEIAKIKDITHDPMTGLIRLQWWRDSIEDIYESKKRSHFVVDKLFDLVWQHRIPKERFLTIINARETEIEFSPPENLNSLKLYAEKSSSDLIRLCLYILGLQNNNIIDSAAYNTGIAWALVGLMRSMRYNCLSRRVFLPLDLMYNLRITPEDLIEGRNLIKSKDIIRLIIDEAEKHIKLARSLTHEIDQSALPLFLPATIAMEYIKRIRKNDYDLFYSDLEGGHLGIQLKLLANVKFGRF